MLGKTNTVRKSPRLVVACCITLLLFTNCKPQYTIEEESVSKILKTLSADELRGRQALTPDIEKAATFISTKFNAAGLETLENQNGFLQSFSLQEVSIQSSSIMLDDKKLNAERFFGFLNGDTINWATNDIKAQEIKEGDNFRTKVQEFSSSDGNVLVFVDPSFSDIFGRYQSFYSRPSRNLEKGTSNTVFVLAEIPATFNIEILSSVEEKSLENVVGIIPGKRADEIVLFSAHYDHIGIRTAIEGDSIANGANDNASGVTAVIELANHFKSRGKPERTLMFAAFTAEEMGGYGSQYFSKQLNPNEIVAMFNIEMIGKPAVSGPNTAWITGYERSTFGELLSKSAEGTIYEFFPDPYPRQNLFYRSDNATLARLGVPAHSISTTPIDVDKDYHQVSDEFETIDIPHLTNTIKAIAKAAEGIVSGKDTPTRVDTSLVD